MDDITRKIIETVAEQMNVPVNQITPETKLEDLGFDSLDITQLKMELEEEFDMDSIEVDLDAESLTVAQLAELVRGERQVA